MDLILSDLQDLIQFRSEGIHFYTLHGQNLNFCLTVILIGVKTASYARAKYS